MVWDAGLSSAGLWEESSFRSALNADRVLSPAQTPH